MNQKDLMYRFLPKRLKFGFWAIILFLLNSSAADDYRYEACASRICGNIIISYPFYILGDDDDHQQSYCGSGNMFGVNCSDPATPIIHIPDNDYVIDQISYLNGRFRVHSDAVTNNTDCLPRLGNTTTYERLNTSLRSSLHLLWNCKEQLPGELLKYKRISCGGNVSDLAILGDDKNLAMAIAECETNVVVPVELSPGEENGVVDYVGILRRGFELSWIASDCKECKESGGRCGFNQTTALFQCFCRDRPYRTGCTRQKKMITWPIFLGTGLGAGIILLLACCYFIFKNFTDVSSLLSGKRTAENREIKALARQFGSLAPKCYSYSNIKKMTNSFKDELGKGGYGTVYKGRLGDGRHVAVKLLNAENGNHQDFINEIMSISRTSHVNIVSLLGFCIQGKKRALVYEYMLNGSLEKYIHSQKNASNYLLGMHRLHQISLGVARGLEYLHRGCNTRILHFDIKPHNILLDEDFSPKISDFGMAKQYSTKKESDVLSFFAARGTVGYIAPELINRSFGVVSHKSDVYSFGMMILEIVGRRKNVIWGKSHESEVFFPHWAYQHLIIHKDAHLKEILVNSEEESEDARKIILVGLWCIQKDPSLRPTMSKVIEMLEGNLQAIEIPPKSFFNNSPSPSPSSSVNRNDPDDMISEYSSTSTS